MKRFISVLVIATMLFALGLNIFTVYADDIILDSENDSQISDVQELRLALGEALDAVKVLKFTDYTEESVAYLEEAIEKAELVYADENAEAAILSEAFTALIDAIDALEAKEVDISELKRLYTMYKYSDTTKVFNQIEFQRAMDATKALLESSQILISELERVELLWASITTVLPIENASDFLSMEKNGSYVLLADIEISESYGEFCGYLYGAGHTVTVNNTSVFETLAQASILNLNIDGSIDSETSVGALANNASGEIFISNVVNNASVVSYSDEACASGFIANIDGASVSFIGCVNNADIEGATAAGFCAVADSGTNNFYFYNCINNGDIVGSKQISSGFVSKISSQEAESLKFEYCSELGNISSQGFGGAFLGFGMLNVEIYGCVVGAEEAIKVNSALADSALGGVIGCIEGGFDVSIDACVFNIDVSSANENAPTALIVGACDGSVAINNTYVGGSVNARGNKIYKLSSVLQDCLTAEKVIIDVLFVNATSADAIDTTENTDLNLLDAESLNDVKYGVIAIVLTAKGMDIEQKIEAVELYSSAFRMLITVDEAELWNAKEELLEILADLIKDEELYTEESYFEYLSDVNQLVEQIYSALDVESLKTIEIEKILESAELQLVTIEDFEKETREQELNDARQLLLILLSAKRENAGDVFTEDSYKEYLKAFDDIVAKINAATTLEELEKIDIALLKVNAENKLVVNIPEEVEDDDEEVNVIINNNDDADDEAEEENVNNATATQGNGCASSAAVTSVAFVSVLGVAFAKKKKQN